jgi:hypothetical protein
MLTLLSALCVAWLMPAQDPHQTMDDRGAMVMGFDQNKTAHHFYLYEDGGAIDITVKDASDTKDRDAIRSHLPHIATMFGMGDFDAPMLVHDSKDVPGTAVLAKQKAVITYRYRETTMGGRVDIVTKDRDALTALHEFLSYQIKEHQTGDPLTVTKRQ